MLACGRRTPGLTNFCSNGDNKRAKVPNTYKAIIYATVNINHNMYKDYFERYIVVMPR